MKYERAAERCEQFQAMQLATKCPLPLYEKLFELDCEERKQAIKERSQMVGIMEMLAEKLRLIFLK